MALTMDGCDDAFIGLANQHSKLRLAVYDYVKLVKVHTDMGMTEEDAVDFVEFNIVCAWVGEDTPLIIYQMTAEDARRELQDQE